MRITRCALFLPSSRNHFDHKIIQMKQDGMSALLLACQAGHEELALFLVAQGSALDVMDKVCCIIFLTPIFNTLRGNHLRLYLLTDWENAIDAML